MGSPYSSRLLTSVLKDLNDAFFSLSLLDINLCGKENCIYVLLLLEHIGNIINIAV